MIREHEIHTRFNVFWMATLADYDGAPDAKGPSSVMGQGNTEIGAVADLLNRVHELEYESDATPHEGSK